MATAERGLMSENWEGMPLLASNMRRELLAYCQSGHFNGSGVTVVRDFIDLSFASGFPQEVSEREIARITLFFMRMAVVSLDFPLTKDPVNKTFLPGFAGHLRQAKTFVAEVKNNYPDIYYIAAGSIYNLRPEIRPDSEEARYFLSRQVEISFQNSLIRTNRSL